MNDRQYAKKQTIDVGAFIECVGGVREGCKGLVIEVLPKSYKFVSMVDNRERVVRKHNARTIVVVRDCPRKAKRARSL